MHFIIGVETSIGCPVGILEGVHIMADVAIFEEVDILEGLVLGVLSNLPAVNLFSDVATGFCD